MPLIIYNTIQPRADLSIQINQAQNAQQNYPIGSTNWVSQQTIITNLRKTYTATYGTLGVAPAGNDNVGGQY
jgi:hypothetical protein